MQASSPKALLISGLAEMGLSISDAAVDQLIIYLNELKKWSRKINLISQAPDQQIIESHFVDSLTLLPLVRQLPAPTLLDVGSGAGFPGLVLKIAHPPLAVTLLEPRQKRVSFLKNVCRTTHTEGVKTICQRLNANDHMLIEAIGQFSLVTCRALTSISEFLQMAHPFVNKGGMVICMKGPQAENEIIEWQANGTNNFLLQQSHQFTLPFSKASRTLVVFQKK
jgi:16S rRNA (guanine527-N7)-methyltransferase